MPGKHQVHEAVIRMTIANIHVFQDRLRQLPILTDDPTEDGMVDALHALDAAVYNLRQYAAKAGITLREGMQT